SFSAPMQVEKNSINIKKYAYHLSIIKERIISIIDNISWELLDIDQIDKLVKIFDSPITYVARKEIKIIKEKKNIELIVIEDPDSNFHEYSHPWLQSDLLKNVKFTFTSIRFKFNKSKSTYCDPCSFFSGKFLN